MSLHRISGTTAASAATDAHAIAQIWNPHTTKRIYVLEVKLVAFAAPGAAAGFLMRRTSARGTGNGSSITSAIGHSLENPGTASQSGFALDLAAFSGQPTLVAGDLDAWVYAAVAASGVVLPYPEGIEIGPGSGLALVNRAAIAFPTSEVSFLVRE